MERPLRSNSTLNHYAYSIQRLGGCYNSSLYNDTLVKNKKHIGNITRVTIRIEKNVCRR
jgi:hypothetical protein